MKTISELKTILERKSLDIVDLFRANKMIVNCNKFQALIIDRERNIKALSFVKLLFVKIDGELNFNLSISNNCKPAANKLNAVIRLKFCHQENI